MEDSSSSTTSAKLNSSEVVIGESILPNDLTELVNKAASPSSKPYGVAPFTYGLWRHFVLLGVLHLIWLFVLLVAQVAGYHGFDKFVISFLGLGGR